MRAAVRFPPPVRPGDRVGVAAVSGPVDPDRLRRGLEALRRLGFEPVPAGNLDRRSGLFAGSDGERLRGLHELAADPSLGAILFARGGHGVLRLLPHLDWELLGRRPRAWVGYSDVTPLLLQVVDRLGIAAFHGPMVAADLARGLTGREERSLLAALAGDPEREVELAGGWWPEEEAAVRGPLLGGCLSLLASLLGTPWAPRLAGAVLFFEEIDEPLYRLDRMTVQMALAGALDGVRGLVVGHLGPGERSPSPEAARRLLTELGERLAVPVAWGAPAGHRAPNLTLPLGRRVRLERRGRRAVLRWGAG